MPQRIEPGDQRLRLSAAADDQGLQPVEEVGEDGAGVLVVFAWLRVLALWWQNNPFLLRKALMLFSPFGFAWLYACAGYGSAVSRLRLLALGTVMPMLALVYVQTPERALANAFFVVVPLATILLSRVPPLPPPT